MSPSCTYYPKVLATVIAFCSEDYVSRAVESLMGQDYPKLKIVIIDDCSKDHTAQVISKYAHRAKIVRNQTNNGFASNLNLALQEAAEEEFLFILEDDVELVGSGYITNAVSLAIMSSGVGLVTGQPVDFGSSRLSLAKRTYARALNLDWMDTGQRDVSYSMLKADLIRVLALHQVGGFGYAGNQKLGAEDQIIAKRLRESGYTLIKDATLAYRLDFARTNTTRGFLRSEANAGRTLGCAVSQGAISTSPSLSKETARKRRHRLRQVFLLLCAMASVAVMPFVGLWALILLCILIGVHVAWHLKDSTGFEWREKPYFVAVMLCYDFVFSIFFLLGFGQGCKNRIMRSAVKGDRVDNPPDVVGTG